MKLPYLEYNVWIIRSIVDCISNQFNFAIDLFPYTVHGQRHIDNTDWKNKRFV